MTCNIFFLRVKFISCIKYPYIDRNLNLNRAYLKHLKMYHCTHCILCLTIIPNTFFQALFFCNLIQNKFICNNIFPRIAVIIKITNQMKPMCKTLSYFSRGHVWTCNRPRLHCSIPVFTKIANNDGTCPLRCKNLYKRVKRGSSLAWKNILGTLLEVWPPSY